MTDNSEAKAPSASEGPSKPSGPSSSTSSMGPSESGPPSSSSSTFTPRGGGFRGNRGFFRGHRGGGFRGGRGRGREGFHGPMDGPPPPHMDHPGGPSGGGPPNQHNNQSGGNRGSMMRGGPGGNRGNRGGGPRGGGGGFDRVFDRLSALQSQSFLELEPLNLEEKKFNGRTRLYMGNVSNELTEDKLKELVAEFGEVGGLFVNPEKNFAFLRFASRAQAETARRALDGSTRLNGGRPLKVRFAPHQAAIRVANLGPWVSNELLYKAFSIFGEIERALVSVDERGRSKGEGTVEFEKKPAALEAVKRCGEGCFFLTSSLRPVVVELLEENEDEEGLTEKSLFKRNQEFLYERETGPRFAHESSFEQAYGQKWKSLHEMRRGKMESLDREMKLEEDKLMAQMEYARYEHETEQLRDQLRRREADRDQQKNQWEERERQMGEMMRQEQERRTSDEASMMNVMQEQDNALRARQQENSLFMQAQELNKFLDQEEAATMNMGRGGGGGGGPSWDGPPQHNKQQSMDGGNRGGFNGGGFHSNNFPGNRRNGAWAENGPGNKRRRF